MAIFNGSNKQVNGNSGSTTIAYGTKLKGEIEIECNLHIDGEIEGIIRSHNSMTIGKSGMVEGDIFAKKLIVSGRFVGSCECDTVEILPEGRIEGKIVSKELIIEKKGYFVGESRVKEENDIIKELDIDSKQPL